MMGQYKMKVLAAAVIMAGSLGAGSGFATTMTNQQIQAMVDQVVAQKTQGLQNEVTRLKSQVVSLKQQLNTTKSSPSPSVSYTPPAHPYVNVDVGNGSTSSVIPTAYGEIPTSGGLTGRIPATRISPNPIAPISVAEAESKTILSGIYLGGTPIFTSPYIGEHSAYDGSNLIVNQSNVSLDARLLKQQQGIQNALINNGFPLPDHPVVEASGEVEAVALGYKQSPGNTQGDINLNDAELDLYAQADPWVFGYASFAWQDSFNSPYRVANSNAIIDKAFITVGDLNKSPFYGSIGQLYVPFGQYSSYMISDTLPKLLARTKARAAVFGFTPQGTVGPFGTIYAFKDDTSSNAKSAAGGANLGYDFALGNVTGTLAGGIISNIADSQGMQFNGAPNSIPFSGFGESAAAESIYRAVPAADVYGNLGYKNFTLIGEYVDTTTSFNPNAMTFNGYGARPGAGQIEADYAFTLHGRPGNFAVGYDWSRNALALLLPQQRYLATINYSFWRDTVESLEFRHDINYSSSDTASGAMSPTFNPLNKYVNMLTAQIAVFF